jgi:two-component system CheB/CheR fusion protein
VNESGLPQPGRDEVLNLLASRRGVDLHDYRDGTLERGLDSRVRALACQGLGEYRDRLAADPEEADRLIRAVRVAFTGFFRDGPVFQALRQVVAPALFRRGSPVRAWCAGVATGQEAWSLAMVLAEAAARHDQSPFEVIATDLDEEALAVARRARYQPPLLQAIPADLRSRFVVDGVMAPLLRQRVRFARHDLVGPRLAPPEAVLASFDLILVRNVLIHFDRRLQTKALDRLAGMLEPGGALVLGEVEVLPDSLATRLQPFAGLERVVRIFERVEDRP